MSRAYFQPVDKQSRYNTQSINGRVTTEHGGGADLPQSEAGNDAERITSMIDALRVSTSEAAMKYMGGFGEWRCECVGNPASVASFARSNARRSMAEVLRAVKLTRLKTESSWG